MSKPRKASQGTWPCAISPPFVALRLLAGLAVLALAVRDGGE